MLFWIAAEVPHGLEIDFRDLRTSACTGPLVPQHANRLERILDRLNAASEIKDMNYPGSFLHQLSGDKKGFYALKVSGNWRFNKDDEIFLYCMDPECRASSIAAEKLENMGFTNIAVYSGGKQDWLAGGLPVEGEAAGPLQTLRRAARSFAAPENEFPPAGKRRRAFPGPCRNNSAFHRN